MVESGGKIGAAWRLSELLRQWKCACHVILNGPASVSASALQCGSTCLNHAIRNCRIPMPSSDAKDDETKPRLTNTLQEVRQDLPNRRISKRWLCPRSRRWRVRGSRTPLKGRRRLLCQRDLLGATTTMTTFHCGWLSPPLAAPIPTLKSWPESVIPNTCHGPPYSLQPVLAPSRHLRSRFPSFLLAMSAVALNVFLLWHPHLGSYGGTPRIAEP